MDFGALDGLVASSENNNNNTLISGYDLDFNPKWRGSFKQERSVSATATDDDWRDLKVAKISQDDFSKAMLLQHQKSNSSSVYSDSQNMLSFSSPNTHAATLPYYARNTTGYGSGGSMRGVIAGVRGPFTPSQWIELEHQALIYKYITVNAPIPSNLLIPIRKALEVAAFSAYPGPHLRHNAYGWGAFHLGFSNNPDPEPGRCRRTDGKKWRCSRDAVADQKYCERHMNRGRHRSRKPVEGQSGHSATTTTTTTIAGAGKLPASPAAAVTTTSTIVSHLNHHQLTTTTNPAASSHENKSFLNKANIGSEKIQLSDPVLARTEFGLVCSDSLLNPLQKNENGCQKSQNSLHQFMDDWPRSDRSQLSNSPPINERLNLSPLRMGLGVGNNNSSNNNNNSFSERQQANWIPVSWENSMGGPLGEVLHHSTNNSPSALNLMTEGWENSTQMSPTGVLQKTAFGSVSNSSTGSSPRADCNLVGSSTIMSSSLPY